MDQDRVVDHYARPDLIGVIDRALTAAGVEPTQVTVEQLAPLDEFHIGGRPATIHLLEQLGLDAQDHIVDIGCGIGGAARVAAGRVANVSGFDLTPEYVETGRTLNARLGLQHTVDLRVGNALSLPVDDAGFDAGYLLHVGMNIGDKDRLFAEVARVLKPGARFGVYDIMRVGAGELSYPVPWASDPQTSHLAGVDDYRAAAEAAGLDVVTHENRAATAKAFLAQLASAASAEAPALGLHVLMGATIGQKVANMGAAIHADVIAPVELIVERPAG